MLYRELSGVIIGAGIEVHRELGPGLLESVYEHCLARELREAGIPFLQQHALSVRYKGEKLDLGFRLDLCVDQRIIVEIKSVEESDVKTTARELGLDLSQEALSSL